MKRCFLSFASLFLYFFSLTALAAPVSSPLVMLKSTSNQMISELRVQKATLKSNPSAVYDIVHRILLPNADMTMMAKSVVGRNAWMNATSQEQKAFINEFTNLLIRTYAAALASYTNQSVKFFPIRGGYENQRQVQVKSEIIQPGGPPIPVNYILVLEGNAWKVIDFSVDNVSLVENFRAQFAQDLNEGGLAHLTTKLKQHNASSG